MNLFSLVGTRWAREAPKKLWGPRTPCHVPHTLWPVPRIAGTEM